MGNSGAKSQPIKDPIEKQDNNNNVEKMVNVEPAKPPSPRQSPRSSPKNSPRNQNTSLTAKSQTIAAPVVMSTPTPAPTSTQTPPQQQQQQLQQEVAPKVDVPLQQTSVAVNDARQQADDIIDKVEDFNDVNRDSVEAYSLRDSVEQYESNNYQDRGSDLTLEETDQDNILSTEINDKRNSNPLSSLQLQKQQNDENNALDYIREVCSPTVSYSLQSDQWAHRKEGLELIQKYIERNTGPVKKMTEEHCNQEFIWINIILRKYFLDRVAPVFYAAYDCFRALLKVYSPYVHGREIEAVLSSMIQPLLQNLGGESTGTNKRTQKEACRCILRIARLTAIDGLGLILKMLHVDQQAASSSSSSSSHVSSSSCSPPSSSHASPPASHASSSSSPHTSSDLPLIGIKQQLILLKILINEFSITESSNGNYDSGISTDLVLSICQVGLNHADDKIRKSSIEIIGIAYSRVGKNLKMFLTNVKPTMLKVLEKKFLEIDTMNGSGPGSGTGSAAGSGSGSGSVVTALSSSASSSSFSSSFHENLASDGKLKSKKSENIRNLAPVVLKNGPNSGSLRGLGGSNSSSRSKLLECHMNSSFSGTAMVSTNPDGEENFVVMRNPKTKDRDLHSTTSATPTTTTNTNTTTSTPTVNQKLFNSSLLENEKENSQVMSIKSPNTKPRLGGGGSGAPGGGSSTKNRFEIIEDSDMTTASPVAVLNKRDKKNINNVKGNQNKSQPVEDNRFYIDESEF